MIKNLKYKLKKNFEISFLILLIILTVISTTFFNYKKNNEKKTYAGFINNVYFNKSLKYIIEGLEPKFKKVKHKVKSGETFDKILENYSIQKKEIIKIKTAINKNINLNKLNTKQII